MSDPTNIDNYIQSPLNKVRKDKFIMVLSVPNALKNVSQGTDRLNSTILPNTLEFSVFGTVVPEVNIPEQAIRYSGQTLKVTGYSREPYQNLSVDFVIDNRFNNYWVIYKWLNLLNDSKQSFYDPKNLSNLNQYTEGSIEKSYQTNISIFGLDEYNKRVIEFRYTQAFPVKLNGIQYSYQDPDEVGSNFEFAYSQFSAHLVEQVETL